MVEGEGVLFDRVLVLGVVVVQSIHKCLGAAVVEHSRPATDETLDLAQDLLAVFLLDVLVALHDQQALQTEVVVAVQGDVLFREAIALLAVDILFQLGGLHQHVLSQQGLLHLNWLYYRYYS